ncbi:hypothetical protein ACTXGL_09745 [Psychrobacter sp. T6-6]|uniref:hypothetical protein n=1 Tax=Psychrobacter sp. T6-6 TaxID=3457452 RepID=UPI003FD52B08
MAVIAACLKTRINNQPFEIQNFVDLDYNEAPISSNEQLSAMRLLKRFFTGLDGWKILMPDMPDPFGGLGGMGDLSAPPDESGFMIGSLFGIEHPQSLTAYNEQEFRLMLSNLKSVFTPFGFSDLVAATDLNDLQQLIDTEINSQNSTYQITVYVEPITLEIHRCSESDIDSLFVEGVQRHVDMFDSIVEMLPHHSPTLDADNYAPAWYDPFLDTIFFKSQYGIHQELLNVA